MTESEKESLKKAMYSVADLQVANMITIIERTEQSLPTESHAKLPQIVALILDEVSIAMKESVATQVSLTNNILNSDKFKQIIKGAVDGN